MDNNSSAFNFDLLHDPVSSLKQIKPDTTSTELEQVNNLWQNYCSTLSQFLSIKEQSQEISRSIGEAKRNNTDPSKLISSMKSCSSQLSALQQTLGNLKKELSAFFIDEATDTTEVKNVTYDGSRHYRMQDVDIESVTISQLETDQSDACLAYLESQINSSFYHHPGWLEVIYKTFNHQCIYLVAKYNTDIVGVLPLARLKSFIFGDFYISMPYFNYGGAVAEHPSIEHKLMSTANEMATKSNAQYVEYRDDCHRQNMSCKTDKVNMILKLPETSELLWQGFSSKLRAQIKRPLRESTLVTVGSLNYLNDFYHVFSRNMRDLGTPVYDKSFFENIILQFPMNCHIIVISLDNRPVSAAFLIGYKDTLEIPWASTIRDVNHLSINMLLYWNILKFAIKNKYKYFDFGRSSKNSGTYQFKRQWGAHEKPMYWHYWLQNGTEMPSLNPSNPKYELIINLWKHLPVKLTQWIGPHIVKNIP